MHRAQVPRLIFRQSSHERDGLCVGAAVGEGVMPSVVDAKVRPGSARVPERPFCSSEPFPRRPLLILDRLPSATRVAIECRS